MSGRIYDRWLAEALGPAPSAAQSGLRQDAVTDDRPAGPRDGGSAQAPVAPGGWGSRADAGRACSSYLDQLGRWRDARQAELDQLDRAALASPTGAVGDRRHRLVAGAVEGGRRPLRAAAAASGTPAGSGPAEREKLSTPDLGSARRRVRHAAGCAVSLPEACRLSDALVGQLRVRLGLEVSALETTERIATLRAQLERIRDQIGLEPPGARQQQAAETQSKLARRLRDDRPRRPAGAATSAGCCRRWRSTRPGSSAT